MKLCIFSFICLLLISKHFIYSQENIPDRKGIHPTNVNYFQNPLPINDELLLTNEKRSHLYTYKENTEFPELLFADTITDFSVSWSKKYIGLILKNNGILRPGIFSFKNRKIKHFDLRLSEGSKITCHDTLLCCLSNDTLFFISDNDIDFITYKKINKIEISPDGSKILFNDFNGYLYNVFIKNKSINEIKTETYVSDFKWSPEGKKIAITDGLIINIIRLEDKANFIIGNGGNFCWSEDSEYLIYQKNQPIKMKFVNSDIFIAKYDNTQTYQITNTNNLFEMQPVFKTNNIIYYTTYEDRAIYKAELKNFAITKEKTVFSIKQKGE
ncbi:MAG: hypothetical protein Kow0068_21470 [Marinilabiliales bacterium]